MIKRVIWVIWSLCLVFSIGQPLQAQRSSVDLVSLLDHKNPEVRENAAKLLGDQKVKTAVEPLISVLDDENIKVRQAVAAALVRITKQNLPPDYNVWSEWWDKEGYKKYSEVSIFGRKLATRSAYLDFAYIMLVILLILLLFFIMVFSFMGGSKIKEMKEIIKRVDKYIYDADEITKKSDKVLDELEQRRTEIMEFFSRLKDENESEIERFSDLLQQNVEHQMREVSRTLREKAETELKQTFTQIREEVGREIKRTTNEQKDRLITEANTRHKKFLNEAEAHTLFIEAYPFFSGAKYDEALRLYKKLLALKSDHYLAWANAGTALKNLTRYNEALESYHKALAISPDNPQVLYNIASTYALMKKKEKMLETLSRAFQFDSELKDEALNDTCFKPYWNDRAFKDIAES